MSNDNITQAVVEYYNLIAHYKELYGNNKPSDIYTEGHHIIPRSLGGTDAQSNVVYLPFDKHTQAHYLLTLIHPDNKSLRRAYASMSSITAEAREASAVKSKAGSTNKGAAETGRSWLTEDKYEEWYTSYKAGHDAYLNETAEKREYTQYLRHINGMIQQGFKNTERMEREAEKLLFKRTVVDVLLKLQREVKRTEAQQARVAERMASDPHYWFTHSEYGEHYVSAYELYHMFKLKAFHCYNMVRGVSKSYKGWTIRTE